MYCFLNSFKSRSQLPPLKRFIEGKMILLLNQQKLDVVSHLLQNTALLLKFSKMSCAKQNCAEPVNKILLEYQTVVSRAARNIQLFSIKCLSILRAYGHAYHYATVEKSASKSLDQYKRIVTKVKEIRDSWKKMVADLRELRTKLMRVIQHVPASSDWFSDNRSRYLKDSKKYINEAEQMRLRREKLNKRGISMSKLIRKMKEETKKLRSYVEDNFCDNKTETDVKNVCQTYKFDTNKCRDVTIFLEGLGTSDAPTQCRALIKNIVQDEKSYLRRYFKGLSQYEQSLIKKKRSYDRQTDTLMKQTLKKFKHLKVLSAAMKRFLPAFNKSNDKDEKVKVKPNNWKEERKGIIPMLLAVRSLSIIKTQFEQSLLFWESALKETKKLAANKDDKITDQNVDVALKESILESGFSWIAVGSVLQTAAPRMQSVREVVDLTTGIEYSKQEMNKMLRTEVGKSMAVYRRLAYRCREQCKDCF